MSEVFKAAKAAYAEYVIYVEKALNILKRK